MTRHRLQPDAAATVTDFNGPVRDWDLPAGHFPKSVIITCDGHRLAGVVLTPPGCYGAIMRTRPPDDLDAVEVRAPGDVVESLTRRGFNSFWLLDGIRLRSWTMGPDDDEPVEVPARPFACRRHRGGHYLDGEALRQVTDDAQRRGRQIVVNVSRVSRIDR